jgi:hypothetical protein
MSGAIPVLLSYFLYYAFIIIIIIKLQLDWHSVAVVQYTFTHKQYTEYRERNIHSYKKDWEVI